MKIIFLVVLTVFAAEVSFAADQTNCTKYLTVEMYPGFKGEELGLPAEVRGLGVFIGGAKQKVIYLSAEDRARYRMIIEAGKIYVGGRGAGVGWADGIRYNFVMSAEGDFYIVPADHPSFVHSSFFAGGPVAAAGEMLIRDGELIEINDRSGHYLPKIWFTRQALLRLRELGLSTDNLKLNLLSIRSMYLPGLPRHWFGQPHISVQELIDFGEIDDDVGMRLLERKLARLDEISEKSWLAFYLLIHGSPLTENIKKALVDSLAQLNGDMHSEYVSMVTRFKLSDQAIQDYLITVLARPFENNLHFGVLDILLQQPLFSENSANLLAELIDQNKDWPKDFKGWIAVLLARKGVITEEVDATLNENKEMDALGRASLVQLAKWQARSSRSRTLPEETEVRIANVLSEIRDPELTLEIFSVYTENPDLKIANIRLLRVIEYRSEYSDGSRLHDEVRAVAVELIKRI